MKLKKNRIVLSIVFLVLGFMLSFSYQLTKTNEEHVVINDKEWERNTQLQNQLNELEEKNIRLQEELSQKQEKLFELEASVVEDEKVLGDLAKKVENLRMILGQVAVRGEGVIVTLDDGTVDSNASDISSYIVHEQHVLNVVNELFISGAEAVAINGKRLTSNSYIECTGPVITVDGERFPAPFVISAIGNADTLEKAINMQGGVKDQLVNESIVFKLEKKDLIVIEPVLSKNS
jgi:uncharacterized protein YlxW (UPF0749 family)